MQGPGLVSIASMPWFVNNSRHTQSTSRQRRLNTRTCTPPVGSRISCSTGSCACACCRRLRLWPA